MDGDVVVWKRLKMEVVPLPCQLACPFSSLARPEQSDLSIILNESFCGIGQPNAFAVFLQPGQPEKVDGLSCTEELSARLPIKSFQRFIRAFQEIGYCARGALTPRRSPRRQGAKIQN